MLPSMPAKVAIQHPFEWVKRLGFSVQYFPAYINRTRRLHAVPVVLISFMLRGHGRHFIERDEFEEHGGSLAVTHHGQRHDIVTDEAGMDVMNVYLDLKNHPPPVLPRELQPVVPLLLPLHPQFVHRQNRIVRLQFDDPQPLADHLFAIERELRDRPPGFEEMARLHFKIFLMLCCRHALEKGFVTEPPSRMETLRQHLDESYAEPHTLAALAKRARLGRTSLCRAFKAHTEIGRAHV